MRLAAAVLGVLLLSAACTYESSGTTTTTTVPSAADLPPATGPADIVVEDQKVEGTTVTIASVTLPADGWVVVRTDDGGAPGGIIGISELLRQGVIARVPVPLILPLTEDAVVHAAVHIDVDRDGVFTYEAPDALVDEIATLGNGQAATASALIELLAPLQPAEAAIADQRTDGSSVVAEFVQLPAPGFVVLMSDEEGAPGVMLGVTALLDTGTYTDLDLFPSIPLEASGTVFVKAWVDRDEDGLFDPELDGMAVRADGTLAQTSALMTVIPLGPTSISAVDQEGDGASVVVAQATLPAPGFIEVLSDAGGAPGERLGVSQLLAAGELAELVIDLDSPLAGDGTFWVRVIIDFDEDGAVSGGDFEGQVTPGGIASVATFEYTIAEES